jgi:hypothetical protein
MKLTRTTQQGQFEIVATYEDRSNRYWCNIMLHGHEVSVSNCNINEAQAKAIHDLYRQVNGLDKQENMPKFD